MADAWEHFFQVADADRDGKISGGEAVAFFQKSGLPQMTLAKVWQIADQGQTGFLDRREFNAALKLVTVAQSGRDLTPDIARMVLSGAGPQIPLPRITGLAPAGPQSGPPTGPQQAPPSQQPPGPGGFQRQGPPSQSGPPRSQQGGFGGDAFGGGAGFTAGRPAEPLKPAPSTSSYGSAGSGDFGSAGGSFGGPQSQTGPRPVSAPGNDLQQRGARPSQPQGPSSFQGSVSANALAPYSGGAPPQGPASQSRGPGFAPSGTPPQSAGGAPPSQGGYAAQPWPRMTKLDVQRYMQVFTSVDTDRDQKITGEQARDLFLSWGIPREILKQIWDLSDQDQDSMLSVREFCIALYLMEKSREGRPLPPVLPTGIHLDEPPQDPRTQFAAQQIAAAQVAIDNTQHAPWAGPGGSAMLGAPTPSPHPSTKPQPTEPPKSEDAAKSAFEDLGPFKPKAPKVDRNVVRQLSRDEQEMVNTKVKTTEELDKKVWQMETDLLDAKQKTEFYRDKMQELILFENKCKNRLAEISDRVELDKKEVEDFAKKYDSKYKSAGETNSRLQQEEALFKELQDKKMELFNAVAALEAGADLGTRVQEKVNTILAELDALRNAAVERATKLGVQAAPATTPPGVMITAGAAASQAASEGSAFGWTDGVTSGAEDWDEDWDQFEDEGFEVVEQLSPNDPGFPLPVKVPAVKAAPNLAAPPVGFQVDFGGVPAPQSPGSFSAAPSSPAASHVTTHSPKGGSAQGGLKPPIVGVSPPPTSSAKKAAQRYAGLAESHDKADTSGPSSPSSSVDTGSDWRRTPGGYDNSDAFSDVRASWGVNSVAASFDSGGPGNVRASQKVGGTLSRLAPPLEERSDAFGQYNPNKWAEDSSPSPAAKPFKPAGLGNILPASDDTFSEAGSGRFSPQAEKPFGNFDDGDPFNVRASTTPSATSAFAKSDAWSAFD